MKSIVLLTHGNWGSSLIEDVKNYFGTKDELLHYTLAADMNHEQLMEQMKQELADKEELILISDLYGSTTYKISIRLGLEFGGKVYTDLSLRLLLDLMSDCSEEYENIIETFNEFKLEEVNMEEIKFVRVDHRLIHGQVITKWMKLVNANKIVIVDDTLGKDPFMADVYAMAAPAGVKVEIIDTQEIVNRLTKGAYANDQLFLLFKNISSVKNAVNNGLKLKQLQLGGVPYEQGRTKVISAVSLLKEEVDFLEEMTNSGTEVVAQIVPEESAIGFDEIKNKF
ncbi:PTS mannose/fructose/sorbose transporter subunit IIAB [Enterococcus hulanensis]|uniref:PTS mannose/fructose/sorbose transporter subunit IIAB n=1 Tax=Enterococcus hulanensis TaxID=2559929 RepID=UPI001A8E06B7|nr:PTS sugar transporter subunit IIB [Enterococcus hulanensis]MBO0458223.1 PTS mannose/fructose/sorbose transporter subunit IIAB [Enterococcus hulanensis]